MTLFKTFKLLEEGRKKQNERNFKLKRRTNYINKKTGFLNFKKQRCLYTLLRMLNCKNRLA